MANYAALQRGLPRGSVEQLDRVRYRVNPDSRLCSRAREGDRGRTACYAPTEHSARRRTCQLLVDPESDVVPDFEPGLYLYGSNRFGDSRFVCQHFDFLTFTRSTLRSDRGTIAQYSVAILGPFVDPNTKRLVVRCIDMEAFDGNSIRGSLVNLGRAFQHLNDAGEPENIVPVPTLEMLTTFFNEMQNANDSLAEHAARMQGCLQKLRYQRLHQLDFARVCNEDPTFRTQVRRILRCFWEIGLYSRRWAGPGRIMPINRLPGPVVANPDADGDDHNPISIQLVGKYAQPSMTGVRLHGDGVVQNIATTTNDYGMLTNMLNANFKSILRIWDTCTPWQREILKHVCGLGLSCYKIDGSGYWLTTEEVNRTDPPRNGNPPGFHLNAFQMYFGTQDNDPRGLVAYSSVFGTGGYCMQIAGSLIGRTVLTLLPHVYKTRPTWAATIEPWFNLHT